MSAELTRVRHWRGAARVPEIAGPDYRTTSQWFRLPTSAVLSVGKLR